MEQSWEQLYHLAVLETDWSKIEERARAADEAMHARLRELSINHSGATEENRDIARALNGLSILRKEVANWQEAKRAG
jgi:hypothetical protein